MVASPLISLDATVLYNVPASFGGILLDNLGCAGTETRLIDCPHNGLNIHNCVHSQDIGVRCIRSPTRKCVPPNLCVFEYVTVCFLVELSLVCNFELSIYKFRLVLLLSIRMLLSLTLYDFIQCCIIMYGIYT